MSEAMIKKVAEQWKERAKNGNIRKRGWTSSLEGYVKTIGEQALGLAWIHRYLSSSYGKWDLLINLVTVIISSASGVLAGTNSSINTNNTTVFVISIIACIMNFFIAALNGLQAFVNFASMSSDNENAAKNYNAIHYRASGLLAKKRRERPPVSEGIVDDIREAFLSCERDSPSPPTWAYNRYRKLTIDNRDLSRPAEVRSISVANEDDTPQKTSAEKQKENRTKIAFPEHAEAEDDTSSDEESDAGINFELSRFHATERGSSKSVAKTGEEMQIVIADDSPDTTE